MAIDCQDNKVEMPCDCLPAPPPTPRPIAYSWMNGEFSRAGSITIANSTVSPTVFLLQANGAGQLVLVGTPPPFAGDTFGYVNNPTITINAPGGAGVTATATLTLNSNRKISGLTITNPGSGYTPLAYYGYTITQEPLASTISLYTDIKGVYFNASFNPVSKLNTYPPPVGWNPISATSIKAVFKVAGAFRRDSVGSVRLRYKLNGTTQGTFMQIYQDTENTLTNFTHISKEITCNTGDLITYEIYTNDGAHIDYVGPVVGLFIPKLN